jgi:sensor c-di-GMP phosphodiesterase-like protein
VTLTDWTNVAIVILAVQAFFLAIILGAVLFVAIWGTSKTIRQLRIFGPRARAYFRGLADSAEQTSQRIATPFMGASAARARMVRTMSAAFSSIKGQKET